MFAKKKETNVSNKICCKPDEDGPRRVSILDGFEIDQRP
jgi:hypothetical protein